MPSQILFTGTASPRSIHIFFLDLLSCLDDKLSYPSRELLDSLASSIPTCKLKSSLVATTICLLMREPWLVPVLAGTFYSREELAARDEGSGGRQIRQMRE
jgi:hypothetical protein